MITDAARDLVIRLSLIAAAVTLAIVAPDTAPAEAVWALLGALAPTPRLGATRSEPRTTP